MRSSGVLVGTFVLLLVGGCAEDLTEGRITENIGYLKETTGVIEAITKTLKDGVAQAKRDGKPMPIDKIAKATEDSGELKVKARGLQELKARIEASNEVLSKDKREQYAARHKDNFQRALAELDAAQKALDVVVREADAAAAGDPDAVGSMEKLKEKLKEGQDEFEVLTKRQA